LDVVARKKGVSSEEEYHGEGRKNAPLYKSGEKAVWGFCRGRGRPVAQVEKVGSQGKTVCLEGELEWLNGLVWAVSP